MSSTPRSAASLRLVAAVCAAPLLVLGTAASAIALPSTATAAQFAIKPTYGKVGQTITLLAKGSTTFAAGDTVAFTGAATAPTVSSVSASGSSAEVAVPADATSGPLSVTDTSTPVTYSGPDFILQQPLDVTITASHAAVTFGTSVVVKATASVPSLGTGQSVSGLKAELLHRASTDSKFHEVGKVKTTNSKGAVSWSTAPSKNGRYEVHFRGTQSYQASTTEQTRVIVHPKLHVNGFSTAPALVSTPVTGTVAPGGSTSKLVLQRQGPKGHWGTIAKTTASHGSFSFTISPSSYTTIHYRVVDLGNPTHTQATSKTLHVTVVHRTLEYGDSGKDVLSLYKALKALHYDVGTKTDLYGWDLLHAVTAFQKVQGDTRDGVATEQVWQQLSHPKVPHLRYPYPGVTAVEVNLTKQILLIAKNGKIWRILDTSTAGGYTYTDSAGEQATAITPTGHFTIKYKIDHLVTDKLGSLYRPSYFDYSGDAIHGEGDSNGAGDVPPYAASHGCVRITDLAVDRYYNVFAVGTSVWIYH